MYIIYIYNLPSQHHNSSCISSLSFHVSVITRMKESFQGRGNPHLIPLISGGRGGRGTSGDSQNRTCSYFCQSLEAAVIQTQGHRITRGKCKAGGVKGGGVMYHYSRNRTCLPWQGETPHISSQKHAFLAKIMAGKLNIALA